MRARTADQAQKYQHWTCAGVSLSIVLSSLLGHATQLNWRAGGGGRT
jgi:hypothetical protein